MKKNKDIYLAVDGVEESRIISFEKIEKIKDKVGRKVKNIKKQIEEPEEFIEISVNELRDILCEECFFNLMSCFED